MISVNIAISTYVQSASIIIFLTILNNAYNVLKIVSNVLIKILVEPAKQVTKNKYKNQIKILYFKTIITMLTLTNVLSAFLLA